ncbi:hypothetical protein JHK87_052784 [Glycine soja]|nr:hypothetical protein JHK87_052784 [Glycine soja]
MSGLLFYDIFKVENADPEGKKYDKRTQQIESSHFQTLFQGATCFSMTMTTNTITNNYHSQ